MKMLNKYNTYICYSEFHLFIALVNVLFDKTKSSYILCPSEIKGLVYSIDIENCVFLFYEKQKIEEAWDEFKKKNKYSFFKYKAGLKSIVTSLFPIAKYDVIFSRSFFFVFNDGTPFVLYLLIYYASSYFTLFEEGELIYSTRRLVRNDIIKRVMGFPLPFGRSAQIKNVQVRFPERLPRYLKKKSSFFDINMMVNHISKEEQKSLLSAFGVPVDSVITDDRKNVLLITQPLSEDTIISEDEKIKLYKSVIAPYMNGYNIYIKPHPRETTDYSLLIDKRYILPSHFPVELFVFLSFNFDVAITLFSTAIHLIPAKTTIILGLDHDSAVEKGWKRICGVKNKL